MPANYLFLYILFGLPVYLINSSVGSFFAAKLTFFLVNLSFWLLPNLKPGLYLVILFIISIELFCFALLCLII